MNIELTPAYMDRPLFLRLAKEYVETLAKFDREIRWDESAWSKAMWRAKLIMEDRTVQGFLIAEEERFDFYPPAFCISEFYIVPEARNRGVGTEAVKVATKGWDGDIFFYVQKSNIQALLFWTAVAEEMEWRKIERSEIDEEEGCRLMVYQTR